MDLSNNILMSELSTMQVVVPVQALDSGAPSDPTSDVIQFAFIENFGARPTGSDWVYGTWSTYPNYNYPWAAKCLVGPAAGGTAGGTTLPVGTYNIWLKVIGSPEAPVFQAGILQIV